jgi:hypothetical protein
MRSPNATTIANDDEEGKNSPETAIGVSIKKRKQKRKTVLSNLLALRCHEREPVRYSINQNIYLFSYCVV